jgi:hypothetical protein
MKFHMNITERKVTLRIEPETDTEAHFLRVLCRQEDVDDIREQMNATRYSDRPTVREITAEAFWTSRLDYGLDKVTAIEVMHVRPRPDEAVHPVSVAP